MAVIPEYQRENLKSAAVGTAGADMSDAQAFGSLARNAGQVADASFSLAVKRKEAKDAALANEAVLNLDVDMENTLRDHQEAYRDFQRTPQERAAIFQTNAERMVQERAKTAPNDEVRRAILESGNQMISSRTKREIAAADANQGLIAYTSLMSAQKLSGEQAAKIGSDETMSLREKSGMINGLLVASSETVRRSSLVLSPEQAQKFENEAPAAVLRGMATGMLAKRPEELLTLLDSKDKSGRTIFDGKLSPEEIKKLREDAETSTLAFEKRRIREDLTANLEQVTSAANFGKSGDIVSALAVTETLQDGPLKTSMRKSFLQQGVTENERVEKVYELMTEYETLMTDKKRNTKGEGAKKKVNMKTSLEDILEFQAKVVEAHALGDITDSTRNTYLTEFLPELQKKVNQKALDIQATDPRSEGSLMVQAWGGIKRIARDPEEAVTLHQEFRKRLNQTKDFSPTGVNKALIQTLDDHRINRFPKSMFLSGSSNAVLDHDKSLATTGVEGKTDTPVSAKIPPATTTRIGKDANGATWKVTYENGVAVRREPVSGN